jgi:acyl-homoserine lactone acylase PvdQ
MRDPDQALSLLPIGQSEHPDSPYYRCNYDLWQQGQLHAAPLTRNAVDKLVVARVALPK